MSDSAQVHVRNSCLDLFFLTPSGSAATILTSADYVVQHPLDSVLKISGVAKHPDARSEETKPYFKCGVTHKNIQIDRMAERNAMSVFLNAAPMCSMNKFGLAKHQDAQSAETNHCFKCGATTYKNVRTTRTGSQTEPTEDKNATNVFPNGVRMHTSASCESWISPRTL